LLSRAAAARWYSDAASPKQEAKQAEGEKVQQDEGVKSSTTNAESGGAEVDKLKADLEAKKKEITNLKVSSRHIIIISSSRCTSGCMESVMLMRT
jgi:hypothetical protein